MAFDLRQTSAPEHLTSVSLADLISYPTIWVLNAQFTE